MSNPTCERLLERLGDKSLPADLNQHLRTCPFCQEARSAFRALEAASPKALSSDGSAALRAQVHQELARTPRARRWWVEAVGVAALNLVVTAVAIMLMHGTALPRGVNVLTLWMVTGVLAALMVSGSLAAFAPRRHWLRAALLAAGLGVAVGVGVSGSGAPSAAPFLRAGLSCLSAEVVLSFLPAAVGVLLLTRMAFEPMRALVVGLSCGAVGVLTLHFHCEVGSASHLLLFHVAPWLGIGVAGFWARRQLRTRNFAP